MINLLRLLKGYVLFEATGGFSERFLNLCKFNSIVLWNVKKEGVKVTAFTSEADFKRLNTAAQRSGMDIKIVKSRGLPHFVKLHKYRLGGFFGVLIVSFVIIYMSTFIWQVEIVSNDGVKINNFTETIEQIGVKAGAKKSKIDIPEVQRQLMDAFPELSWVSLNIFGCKAQIEYSYAHKASPIIDENIYTNVVAGKNGEVVLVDGYKGVNKIKAGENVAEGSLLISGVIKNANGTEGFVHARGKVLARTKNKNVTSFEAPRESCVTTHSKATYKPVFFGITFPLGRITEELKTESTFYLSGNGEQLPVGVIRVDCLGTQQQALELTEEQQRLGCLLKAVEAKRRDYTAASLEKVKYSSSFQGGRLSVITEITCVEDIAVEKPVLVE